MTTTYQSYVNETCKRILSFFLRLYKRKSLTFRLVGGYKFPMSPEFKIKKCDEKEAALRINRFLLTRASLLHYMACHQITGGVFLVLSFLFNNIIGEILFYLGLPFIILCMLISLRYTYIALFQNKKRFIVESAIFTASFFYQFYGLLL